MDDVVIATTNRERQAHLSNALLSLYPSLNLHPLPSIKCPPLETGTNEHDNALIKAKFYSQIATYPVLVVDAGVYFNGLETTIQPGHRIHDFINHLQEHSSDLISSLNDFFIHNKIRDGYIKKVFILANATTLSEKEIRIPVKIKTNPRINQLNHSNPLNHFLIPAGFTQPFSEFSHLERQRYESMYTTNIIRELCESFQKESATS